MLKSKILVERSTFQFPKQNFSLWQTERVCQFCKKTFCCKKCRNGHVDKVHSGLNADCFLCASKALPVRQSEIGILLEDEELLCHIVDKHLPLHCQLCGNLIQSKEDFKFFGVCKWWSQCRNPLTSPMDYEPLEKKLKQCFLSDSDCNGSRFSTPSEIYRKTSTPRLVGQKASFEYQTPCASNFSLQTHESQNTVFLSFSPHYLNEETTPFKIGKEQFLRSNSGRKLDIMEECDEIANHETENIVANTSQSSSTSDMNLTIPINSLIAQCTSPESNIIRKEPVKTPDVKKVRFSDQHETFLECKSLTKSYVENILNISTEEDDVFHDVCEMSRIQNAKNAENSKDTENAKDIKNMTENMKDTKDIINNQVKIKKLPEKLSTNLQIQINQDNVKNTQDENRSSEINNTASSALSEQGSNGMMMIVLMENHSYNTDLVPLIDSGLKKLQEQLASISCQLSSDRSKSSSAGNLRRKSITKMEMRVSSVESDSINGATTITNHQQIISSSSSFMQNNENSNSSNSSNNSGGFLSTVTQAMKSALRSFSVLGVNIPAKSIEMTKVIRRREIIEESTSSKESSASPSNFVSSVHTRPGKRSRDDSDEDSSKADSIELSLDVKSPLAKRQRGWYTMIKGRQPIKQVRKSRTVMSPRGMSAETQIFSKGSLTVGDTILPLPARAHQSTQTE